MPGEEIIWDAPPLSPEDQRLVDAYVRVGRPVDELAYTDAFDDLYSMVNGSAGPASKHDVYKRLLTLRKMARLPRLYVTS